MNRRRLCRFPSFVCALLASASASLISGETDSTIGRTTVARVDPEAMGRGRYQVNCNMGKVRAPANKRKSCHQRKE